ncbi:hypothetical protein [Marinobacterium aestuariivivens]|uniref:Competence protein CoiA-like N-terminal domain-containing protein n=1 Tax=Marinobacterium aestuariivivens TaxID=1698799 RepID=A0ABW2A6R8_9GAMM
MNKVPFALHIETKEYVDVHDVERGRKCKCICPSCDTPLTARQGDVNEWHFAHATRGTSEETKQDCKFSFYVSVTQMAKQLFAEKQQLDLALPDFVYTVKELHPISGGRLSKDVTVTLASDAVLEDVKLEATWKSLKGDVLGLVHGVPLIIGFHHPERKYEIEVGNLEGLEGERVGVLRVDLTETLKLFYNKKQRSQQPFKERLDEYIFSDRTNLEWLYHPRLPSYAATAREELMRELSTRADTTPYGNRKPSRGDFIDRALAGFSLNRPRR